MYMDTRNTHWVIPGSWPRVPKPWSFSEWQGWKAALIFHKLLPTIPEFMLIMWLWEDTHPTPQLWEKSRAEHWADHQGPMIQSSCLCGNKPPLKPLRDRFQRALGQWVTWVKRVSHPTPQGQEPHLRRLSALTLGMSSSSCSSVSLATPSVIAKNSVFLSLWAIRINWVGGWGNPDL